MTTEIAFISPRREKDPDKYEMGGNLRKSLYLYCLCYETCLLHGSEVYYAKFGAKVGASVNYV